jgi:dipeptide/tripeptide permease
MLKRFKQFNDNFWRQVWRLFRRKLNIKAVTSRWGIATAFFAITLFCITLASTILLSGGGRMMVWVYILLGFALISFLLFISFWIYVAGNPSVEDEERQEAKRQHNRMIALLEAIARRMGIDVDKELK